MVNKIEKTINKYISDRDNDLLNVNRNTKNWAKLWETIEHKIEKTHKDGIREGLEMAAKIVKEACYVIDGGATHAWNEACRANLDAIRSIRRRYAGNKV